MINKLITTIFSFKGLYVAFFIAVVLYGQVRLFFGLTPRHIAIVVMLIACMRQGVPFPMGRIMKTFVVFLLSFLISATITGYLGKVLITYYIAVWAGYWATKIMVTKYNDGKLLLNTIVGLGVFSAIVTIGQTFNMGFPDRIISFLRLNPPDKYLEVMEVVEKYDNLAPLVIRPGLFSGAVYNGYFLMTAGVLSLMLMVRKFYIHRIIPWIIIMYGCICSQERGPIIILAVLSVITLYRLFKIKQSRYILFLPIVSVIVIYFLASFSLETFIEGSRLAELGVEDELRGQTYRQTIEYLMDHPLIGGVQRLRAMYDIYPHNLFLLAFTYGGIVGGFSILIILLLQTRPLWRILSRKITTTNTVCFFAGLAYFAYTLNSMVHNRSIVTGDEVIWMLWATFYFEYIKFYPHDKRL